MQESCHQSLLTQHEQALLFDLSVDTYGETPSATLIPSVCHILHLSIYLEKVCCYYSLLSKNTILEAFLAERQSVHFKFSNLTELEC